MFGGRRSVGPQIIFITHQDWRLEYGKIEEMLGKYCVSKSAKGRENVL